MKIYHFIILIAICLSTVNISTSAQESKLPSDYSADFFSKIQQKDEGSGKVIVYQDVSIKTLISKHISQNIEQNGIQGFRIRIFSDLGQSAREKSQEANAKFNELFPEISVYREYDSPYYKVYAGDYRSKNDAIKDFKRIKRQFPAAFVVPGRINLPKIDE